jgi:hypothetical protein
MNDEFESLSFRFYLSKTTPKTNAFFKSDFWDTLVLQISHSEPAVKHAVLALSALHRGWETDHQGFVQDKTALIQYSKAVGHASKLLTQAREQAYSTSGQPMDKEAVDRVLVACILFICYENLVGNYASAQMHLRNGMSILMGNRRKALEAGISPQKYVEDDVVNLFSRFDFQAMTFSDAAAPYRYLLSELDGLDLHQLPTKFTSLSEAGYYLFDTIRYIFRIGEFVYQPGYGNPAHTHPQAKENLDSWATTFEEFLYGLSGHEKTRQRNAISLLKIYQITAGYVITAGFTGYETEYDKYMSKFEELLSLIESLNVGGYSSLKENASSSSSEASTPEPPPRGPTRDRRQKFFSLECGMTIPLFYMAIKCRDPVLRRKAIAILGARDRREGLWDSIGASLVAERVAQVEEEAARASMAAKSDSADKRSAGKVLKAEDIAEEQRVVIVKTMVNLEKRGVKLQLLSRPDGVAGEWAAREEWVDC